jgi:predicted glycosyltransferase
MKVMIVVTHLLGSGHLSRALTLARGFVAGGCAARVVSGGMPAPHLVTEGVEILQLPPVRSDGVNFTQLLDETDEPAGDGLFASRRAMMIRNLTGDPPDVLITELFPFGRRSLRSEFTALLEAAGTLARPPLICASIRDILAPPSKPAKVAWADDLIARFYDAVLVHSDAAVTPLTFSWPVADAWSAKMHYTGFVAPAPSGPHPDALGAGEVLVSAGGGNVGAPVYEAALQAARLDGTRRWRLLVGGNDTARRAALAERAPANVTVTPGTPAFRQMLYHAAASVSLCGYNTALDVLQSGVRAVFVPFDDGNEVEQGLRAGALAALPGITLCKTADLTGQHLLSALDIVGAAPARAPRTSGFDGAARTVEIVRNLRKAMQ